MEKETSNPQPSDDESDPISHISLPFSLESEPKRKTTQTPLLLNALNFTFIFTHTNSPLSHSHSLSLALCFSVMASTEDSMNPQSNTLLQQPPPPQPQHEQLQLQHLQHHQQQLQSSLPQYPEMIMAAIEDLNEKGGSSKAAISKQMESAYPDLPAAHATLLSHHLGKMKQSGQLAMVKNNYIRPDPDAPPKRGRGRPPKPKTPLPPGAVVSPPRPRGRPPKPRDPFAPPAPPKKKSSGGSGRPRGRPPKKAKTAPPAAATSAPAAAAAAPTGAPRGRGRPPKVKPAVAPVAG
ncbi:hypothetical protein ACOSQ2_019812 [Xanthoceras sorbifolium]